MRLYSCAPAAAHYLFIIPGLVWNDCKKRKKSLGHYGDSARHGRSDEDQAVNFGKNLWIWAAVIVLLFVLFEMFQGSTT